MMAPDSEIGQFSNLILDDFLQHKICVLQCQLLMLSPLRLILVTVKKPFMKFITHSASYAFFLSEYCYIFADKLE